MSVTHDNRNGPRTGEEFAAAARDLLANGFSVEGVAEILRADLEVFRRMRIAEVSRETR